MYIDLHTHTTYSDGKLTARELIAGAKRAGLSVLAITDHNAALDPEEFDGLRAENPDLHLVRGSEISCTYQAANGQEVELHVVALGFDPHHAAIQRVLAQNQIDRRGYIEAILAKLRPYGIDLGTYDDLVASCPDSTHVGRMHLANLMWERGHTASVKESFDEYIGRFGKRRAFVENPARFVTLEEGVAAIREAGGLAVLAHLFYYQLDEDENLRLVKTFRDLAGENGALEVHYSIYTPQQREYLQTLCRTYDLLPSAGSDFHGYDHKETLDNRFSYDIYEGLAARYRQLYGEEKVL